MTAHHPTADRLVQLWNESPSGPQGRLPSGKFLEESLVALLEGRLDPAAIALRQRVSDAGDAWRTLLRLAQSSLHTDEEGEERFVQLMFLPVEGDLSALERWWQRPEARESLNQRLSSYLAFYTDVLGEAPWSYSGHNWGDRLIDPETLAAATPDQLADFRQALLEGRTLPKNPLMKTGSVRSNPEATARRTAGPVTTRLIVCALDLPASLVSKSTETDGVEFLALLGPDDQRIWESQGELGLPKHATVSPPDYRESALFSCCKARLVSNWTEQLASQGPSSPASQHYADRETWLAHHVATHALYRSPDEQLVRAEAQTLSGHTACVTFSWDLAHAAGDDSLDACVAGVLGQQKIGKKTSTASIH